MWIVIFSSFVLISIILTYKLYGNIFSPIGIYGTLFNGLLALSFIGIAKYNTISNYAIIIYIGSFITFLLGALTGNIIFFIYKKPKNNYKKVEINHKKYYKILIVLNYISWVGISIYILTIIKNAGIEAILSAKYFRSLNIDMSNSSLINYMISVSLAASILCGLKDALFKSNRMLTIKTIAPALIYSTITGSRALAIWAILFYISPFLILYKERTLKFKNIKEYINKQRSVYYIIGFLIAFFIIVALNKGAAEGTKKYLTPYMNINISPLLFNIYIYLTGPFIAFSEHLSNWHGTLMWGQNMFTPIAKLLSLIGFSIDYNILLEVTVKKPEFIPFWFNTFTYLRDVFDDFGFLGIIIFPYLLSLVGTYYYLKCRYYKNIVTLLIETIVYVQFIFSFTSIITSYNPIWFSFILSYIILRFI
jgi:oligosaccharide repeat unit polymerase